MLPPFHNKQSLIWQPKLKERPPWWLSGKEPACQCRRRLSDPWVRKIPWRRKWQPPPVFLTGKYRGQRSLVSYSSWDLRRGGHNLVTKQQHKYKGKNTGPEVEIWVPVPTLL